MRAGLFIRIHVAAAFRGVTFVPMPTGHNLAPFAYVPDGERRDGSLECVIERKNPVVAVPVLPRRASGNETCSDSLQSLLSRPSEVA